MSQEPSLPKRRFMADNRLGTSPILGHCGQVSSPEVPPGPDSRDLRGLARGLRELFELAARTLTDEAAPSALALRVTEHLGCELTAVVPVAERFPSWEHVNIQRGVDAYLASHRIAAVPGPRPVRRNMPNGIPRLVPPRLVPRRYVIAAGTDRRCAAR